MKEFSIFFIRKESCIKSSFFLDVYYFRFFLHCLDGGKVQIHLVFNIIKCYKRNSTGQSKLK